MAKSESRHHGPRTTESIDDVEQSLELLDKVLSEFDEKELSPTQAEPESPSQGHQSEDDGYMSMNGRRAKFVPDFPSTDETPQPPHHVPPDGKYSPPTPEEAERIISNLLPRISPNNTAQHNSNSRREFNDWKTKNKINTTADFLFGRSKIVNGDGITATIISKTPMSPTSAAPMPTTPLQTTLPKARPTTVLPRYASLPSTSPPRLMASRSIDVPDHSKAAVLGIGISAVHDAVLRGIARIPEPIVNEHPVTIYPGRSSPSRKPASRTLITSGLESRHLGRSKHLSSSHEHSTSQESSDTSPSSGSPTKQINRNNTVFNKIFVTNNKDYKDNKYDRQRHDSDDDRFSDDSLEDTSLPPPPPPPVVPPPPTLSAPVTPSKRHSIAWEINLDDPKTLGDPLDNMQPCGMKVVGRRRGRSMSGSQSSLASTPGQSNSTSNKLSGSSEWPDPPDIPICSTEDEAASIYSDSDELQIPQPQDMTGRGTYVIRKGRKQRQRLADLDSMTSSINSRLSEAGNLANCVPSPIFPASLIIPKSRHSIDLGAQSSPSHYPTPFVQTNISSLVSPRSRLSLDLSSPTSELPQNNKLAATNNNNNNNINNTNFNISIKSSPRYTEFKTYSSTFDGLQALDTSSNNINRLGSNSALATITSPTSTTTVNITGSATTVQQLQSPSALNPTVSIDFPLMRVASLPVITPPLTGDILIATPRRELAPPLEEDEEMDSETHRAAPLREIENNISALLRGDIAVARIGEPAPLRRPVGFRPGVHKSESAKEMLLSQLPFGPLPATPPSSSPEIDDSDEFPPLPPSPKSPTESKDVVCGIQNIRISSHGRRHEIHPPAVPPHKGPSLNTLKTRSMDAGFSKSYKNGGYSTTSSSHGPGTLPPDLPGSSSRRRLVSGFPRRAAQSPREERRLQTSCSLPETPIFARGCDIPRTPHRRAPEIPAVGGGSRTAPRNTTSLNSSIVGIAGSTSTGARQRTINHALANGEMLRLAGGPARGWYPRQRQSRPVSTENLDRLHVQGSLRAWDAAGTASRKPLTLPPNLTPKFFNKSPREALRRVTSLLIRKGNGTKEKEPKKEKEREKEKDKDKDKDKDNIFIAANVHRSPGSIGHVSQQTQPQQQKKKGFFKSFWKKSRHYSLEQ